jgi:hypothetical protein
VAEPVLVHNNDNDTNVSGKTTISVSELPQGVYFLRVNYEKEFRIKKVIVE